jgi:hypothetical protein
MVNKSPEVLNKQDILKDFKDELNIFKNQIEKKQNWENISFDIEKYEKAIYNWLVDLQNNITDLSDRERFKKVLEKLNNPSETISIEEIDFLSDMLEKLEHVALEKTDLEKLNKSVKELDSLRWELNTLKWVIENNPKLKEIKEKIENYKQKLEVFSVEHPIWTKALIMLLPANLAWLFSNENIENKSSDSWLLSGIKEIFGKIQDFMAQMAVVFFSWLAPKEMKEFLTKIKEDLWKIDPKVLAMFSGKFSSVTDKVSKIDSKAVSYTHLTLPTIA